MALTINSYYFVHNINCSASAIEKECVYCRVSNKSLNIFQVVFFL